MKEFKSYLVIKIYLSLPSGKRKADDILIIGF